jgi:F-type H+-transporting ATPase subunit delta
MAEQNRQTGDADVLEDPSVVAVARVYANAYLDATGNDLEEFASFMQDVLAANPEFASLLTSGATGREEKIVLIDRAIAPHCSEPFANFLRTLAAHDRLEILDVVYAESRRIAEERAGQKRVRVTSAVELSDETVQKIQDRLGQVFSFEPIIETSVDPSLIGGLIIQVEDTVYDSSLRNRLTQLRDRMRERSLHEIQSGRDRFSHPEGD